MKANHQILTLFLALILSAAMLPGKASAQQNNISFQVFYDQLSPYGQWFNNPAYGYVWAPDAGADFVPYSTAGHWILTEYGWTWVSDYDWGWAPFHYGRWDYDDYAGWFWIPDTQWGPAWVVWSQADGYYGWAPMQPGISLNVYFGNDYHMQNDHWMFVRDRDFQRSNLNRYYLDRDESQRIITQSRIINKTYIDNSRHTTYVSGPGRDEVQKNTGKPVREFRVHGYDKPGQKIERRQLQIYRPQVTDSKDYGRKPAPAKVVDKQDVKHPSGRNTKIQPQNSNPARPNGNQQQPPAKQKMQQPQELQQGKQRMQDQQQKQQQDLQKEQQVKDQQKQQQAKDEQLKQQQEQQKQQQSKDEQLRQQQEQQKQQQVKEQEQRQLQEQQKQQQVKDQQQRQQQDRAKQQPRKVQQQQSPQQHRQEPAPKPKQPATVKPQEHKTSTPPKPANTKKTSKDKEKPPKQE